VQTLRLPGRKSVTFIVEWTSCWGYDGSVFEQGKHTVEKPSKKFLDALRSAEEAQTGITIVEE